MVLLCTGLVALGTPKVWAEDQKALEARLAYLKDIPEISWVKFNRNNVYLGFSRVPKDLPSIVGGAALFGNRAYGFGVHVWAVPADNPNWKVGDPYYCEATGRYGKVQDNSCR
jgi:hypothetical protein